MKNSPPAPAAGQKNRYAKLGCELSGRALPGVRLEEKRVLSNMYGWPGAPAHERQHSASRTFGGGGEEEAEEEEEEEPKEEGEADTKMPQKRVI